MSLHRTGTVALDDQVNVNGDSKQIWGKLVPISNGLTTQQLSEEIITIGRNPQCKVQILDKRLSGKHCQITKSGAKVTLTDLSTNGTFLKDHKIGKNKSVQLKDNDQIWILPASKVNVSQTFGFRIQLLFERKQKEKQQEERKKKQEEQKNKKQEVAKQNQKKNQINNKKANDFAQSIKDQITCSFCFQIMYIPVSVQPCNHRFCGACLTQLVTAKKQQCIQCRKDMTTAVRDSIFNSIIQDYLKTHPQQKRSDKQQQQAKKKNIFGHDPIDIHERIHGKKKAPVKTKAVVDTSARNGRGRRGRALIRTGSDLSASDDDQGSKCRQCSHSRNGFQCSSSQIHVACHTCGKLMANRDDPSLHQYCVLCTTHFCNLYFPPCAKSGVKLDLLKNKRNGVKIDAQLLRGNKYQFDAIKNYLLSQKQTSKDVFDYMLQEVQKKNFSYLFDKKVMKIPPMVSKEVQLQPDSAVCDLCWKDLWFQMVLAYRNAKSASFPSSVKDRPICYWGVNCRTMDHNADHAKRYNHLIFQTRFS